MPEPWEWVVEKLQSSKVPTLILVFKVSFDSPPRSERVKTLFSISPPPVSTAPGNLFSLIFTLFVCVECCSFFSSIKYFYQEGPVGTRRPTDVRGTYQLRPLVPVHFGRPEDVHMRPNLDVVLWDVLGTSKGRPIYKVLCNGVSRSELNWFVWGILNSIQNSFFNFLCFLEYPYHSDLGFFAFAWKIGFSKTTNLVTSQ